MKARILLIGIVFLFFHSNGKAQDLFGLKPELEGQHPRILFTAEEASARALLVQKYMPAEWTDLMNDCNYISYPTGGVAAQKMWWYFSRLGIGIAMSGDQDLIDKGNTWLITAYGESWEIKDATASLDDAHRLAGFAILYDCMYPYLKNDQRTQYERLMGEQLVAFRVKGYDLNDYWTNDYQNNHMHFRSVALLYCTIILSDKNASLQSEYDNVKTLWERIAYVAPPDGSNHEGLNYSNYGGQMLFPGIAALKHCTDMDLTLEEHYKNIGYYYLYHVVPGYSSGFGFGDASNAASASGPNYLFQIASETQDPHINFLAHQLRQDHPGDFYLSQWPVLYTDPLLDKVGPERLPLHRYFEDLGVVITRSSWEDDATAVAFKCGPMGGHILNETRGTDYSHKTDYINVAHDDPDAGTFLIYSKGSFLTTGDGYEKIAKVTQNHSTFIVDDETQSGGGAGWSQPSSLNKLAWQKDVFAINDRVVFTGDMTGVYTDMQKLERTFVSHKAGYILIYDQAKSNSAGRTFEWRLQTEGSLIDLGDRTYSVENGNSDVMTRILQPASAEWSETTSDASQINGKILRTRLSDQEENSFLVMLWPNAANLNALTANYSTEDYQGVKVSLDGNIEYTLFKEECENQSTLDNFSFNASTLVLVQRESDQVLESVQLVNGDSISYGDQFAMNSDMPMNFGLESMESDGSEMRIRIAPSSGSIAGQACTFKLGELSPNTSFSIFKEQNATAIEMITDAEGWGTISLELDEEISLFISELAVNPTLLEARVADAQWLYDQSDEGSASGEYSTAARAQLSEAIEAATAVLETYSGQGEVDQAIVDLEEAMDEFEAAVNTDVSMLEALVDDAFALLNSAIEGEDEGMYEVGSKATFLQLINEADGITEDVTAIQDEIDLAFFKLIDDINWFKSKVQPAQVLSIFSDIPYYGDIENYFLNTESIWEVVKEGEDVVVGMGSYSTDVGQYMLIKDSIFKDFDLEFEARSVDGEYPSDIMIVLGCQDDNYYSFIKLSELVNKSGVYTKSGPTSSFSWVLTDYETYGVSGNEWSSYRVHSLDSVITVSRDDQELFVLEPQTAIRYSGKLGIGTHYWNQAYFDNINVTRLQGTSSIRETQDLGLRFYPNPVGDILNLELDGKVSSISFLDCRGVEVMYQSCLAESGLSLNLESLPGGIYFLRYISEDGSIGYECIIKN